MPLPEDLEFEINKIQEKGLFREEKFFSGADFITNDYFSLRESRYYEKYLENTQEKTKIGSRASRYLGGMSPELKSLEDYLRDHYQAKRAFFFPAGYLANLAIISTFAQAKDLILYDEYIHASLKDGIRLSLAKSYAFYHLDLENLKSKLNRLRPKKGNVFVVTESVFSMEGKVLPLTQWLRFCEENDIYLILDEAHSVGLLGVKGKGLGFGISSKNLLCRMVGFGKAFALQGGAVLFHEEKYATYFAQKARPLIYSTAPHPLLCSLVYNAHKFFHDHQEKLWQKLQKNIHNYSILSNNFGFKANLEHPIQILTFSKEKTLLIAELLNKAQFATKAILPPTVPPGKECIRLVIKRKQNSQHYQKLFSIISKYE